MRDAAPQRYIVSMRLENFQSHRDSFFPLGKGSILITGSSDSGKSALLRAASFVFHNEWKSAWTRMGTTETRVTVAFSDGTEIVRFKGDRNAVSLKLPDGTEETFEKIGTTIPQAVKNALGNPPIDERRKAIAYTDQMEPLYMVALGPEALPRAISEMVGIADFEEAATALSKKARAAGNRVKDSNSRINATEEGLLAYSRLGDDLEALGGLQDRLGQIATQFERLEAGRRLSAQYEDLMTSGKAAAQSLKDASRVAALAGGLEKVAALRHRLDDGRRLQADGDRLLADVMAAARALAVAEKTSDGGADLADLGARIEMLSGGRAFIAKGQELLQEGNTIKVGLDAWRASHGELVAGLGVLVADMKAQGQWCSQCDRPAVAGHGHTEAA